MDFRYKIIICFLLLASCKKEVQELVPEVNTNKKTMELDGVKLNSIKSDFYNFDGMEFTFSHFKPSGKDRVIIPVFIGKNNHFDSLEFLYTYLPYDNFIEYYAGRPNLKSKINLSNNTKVIGDGTGPLLIRKINDNDAEIRFDMKVLTDYRLPDGQYLETQISGRLLLPIRYSP